MHIIKGIQEKIVLNAFEFSEHAMTQCLIRGIEIPEIRQAISVGEVIEDYPDDKYGPRVLILGWTFAQRPLHIQCSYPSRPRIKIITVYEPYPHRWIDYKIRR
jgi:hypothetical protein